MDNPHVWLHICSHLDNGTLKRLARTRLWLIIREIARSPLFWYARVCHFTCTRHQWLPSSLWKEAYYSIVSAHPKPATTKLLLRASTETNYDWNPWLEFAIKLGEPGVVKLLLADPRVKPELGDPGILMKGLNDEGVARASRIFIMDRRVRASRRER